MNLTKINSIIKETIDNLLVEEFGIIYSLDKFGDYIYDLGKKKYPV